MNQEKYNNVREVQKKVDFLINHGDAVALANLRQKVNTELKNFLKREVERDNPLSEYFEGIL